MTANLNISFDAHDEVSVVPQTFESEIFGNPVWRLDLIDDENCSSDAVKAVITSAQDEGVQLVACRIDADSKADGLLASAGFRRVERLQTYERDIPKNLSHVSGIEIACDADADSCAELGRTAFVFDRYHADSEIPDRIADDIKRCWAHNGVMGRADKALIARSSDGKVQGFNLCMRRGDDAIIDLIAVTPACHGQGIGRKLVEGALERYSGAASRMLVGTQETNTASVALYSRTGFTLASAADTWHWTPNAS